MAGVASPCINVCSMDDSTGFCKGCFRSLQEVAAWPKLSDPQKLEVLERLELRKINGVK